MPLQERCTGDPVWLHASLGKRDADVFAGEAAGHAGSVAASISIFPDYFIAPPGSTCFLKVAPSARTTFGSMISILGVLKAGGPRDVFVKIRDPRWAGPDRRSIGFHAGVTPARLP